MPRKAIVIGILTLLFLLIPAASYADQHYDQYPGNGFQPLNESTAYTKLMDGKIYHNDTSDQSYCCTVNFNVPDGSTYFIKSIGMRFYDNLTDGFIQVELLRKNLYTGNIHTVASWSSSYENASSEPQTASRGTEDGVKLVDTKKFGYFLRVYFYRDGVVNPSLSLGLYQVRVHYGT